MSATAVTTAPSTEFVLPSTETLVCIGYGLIAFVFLLRLAVGYAAVRRLVRCSRVIDHTSAVLLATRFCGRTGSGPELRESDKISVPLTAGWLAPKVVLPARWREWDNAKLEAVLAHEIAHASRRDWLVAILSGLNNCIFWFHPL